MKRFLLILLVICEGVMVGSAQMIEEKMTANGYVSVGGKQYAQYKCGITYYIDLSLPDVAKARASQRKVLTAVRDTILSKALGCKYVPGDKKYAQVLNKFLAARKANLKEMMTPFKEELVFAYKWFYDIKGVMTNTQQQMDARYPFYSYCLKKESAIGNLFQDYRMLHFDMHTGRLLEVADFFLPGGDVEEGVRKLIINSLCKKLNVKKIDYAYTIGIETSFEVHKDGLSFYVMTENPDNPMEESFVKKEDILPFLQENSLLMKYWKEGDTGTK